MENLVKDAIGDIPEDDGPHTSDIPVAPNFTTVANPEDVINQSSSEGNRDFTTQVALRKSGKPFKSLRSKKMSYGVEDFSGAVAGVAMGEETIMEKDEGEYDYEGDMAKSQLRSILHNAKMLHDMLEDNTNLPEWVQSKITLAEDYIVTSAQYINASMNEEVEDLDEISRFKEREIAHELRHEDEYERKNKRPYPGPRRTSSAPKSNEPHAVHVNGKKWKTFSSHSHATNVANKLASKSGKKVSVHKEEVHIDEVNKSTLQNYVSKAAVNMSAANFKGDAKKVQKRAQGIRTAVKKMKEELESIREGILGMIASSKRDATRSLSSMNKKKEEPKTGSGNYKYFDKPKTYVLKPKGGK